MKRKYKILTIILICALLAYFIYIFNREDNIYLVSLGDGIASGETPYNIDGISYNDYIKEYFMSKRVLKKFDNTYSAKNYNLMALSDDLKSNIKKDKNDLSIQQIIHKASVITIAIGEEELTKLAMTKDLDKDYIDKYLHEFDNLIFLLKDITEAKIVIVGYYENKYLDKTSVILLNSEIANIAIKYNSTFINISDLFYNKDYFLDKDSFYFSYKGHKEIAEMIIHSL